MPRRSAPLGETPPRRTGGSKSSVLCRTCLRCRTKKVKCSGDKAGCASCAASNLACRYPEDARRSGRTTKADTRALENEIFILRQLIAERREPGLVEDQPPIQIAATAHVGEPDQSRYDANIHEDSQFHEECRFHRPYDTEQTRDSLQSPEPQHVAYQQPARNTPARANSLASPGIRHEQTQQGVSVSPTDAYIAGTVTEDGQVQAYGITSTLHEPPAAALHLLAGDVPVHEDQDERNIRNQLVRDQLISNALIQRQREASILLAGPKIETKIELDGVAPDLAFHLLNLHWNRQHYSYLLTYRPAIMDSLINGGQYANKLLLNAIYYSSSIYSDRVNQPSSDDDTPLDSRFYHRFKQLLIDEIDQPSIPTAVALLLCGASLVSHGKQSSGWVFCGTAYRMIIDLGCHLNIEDAQKNYSSSSQATLCRLTAIEFEIRKRVYWGAFITDKFQSLYLGRAPALRASEAQIPKDLLDCYEELELWEPYRGGSGQGGGSSTQPIMPTYQPRPAYAVSTFASLLALADIAGRVVDAFYSKQSMNTSSEALGQTKMEIERELHDWYQNLPPHLHFDPDTCSTPPPHQITPHTTYWTLTILLERPFLSTGHLNLISHPASQARGEETCANAVLKIWGLVKAYKGTFTLRRAPYLLCYATYSAVLVILRQTQHTQDCWSRFSECVPFFWSALLDLQQGCNAGLKKPLNILKTLMHRMGADNIPQLLAANGRKSRTGTRHNNESTGIAVPPLPPEGGGAADFNMQDPAVLNESLLTAEFLESLELDIGGSEQWFNTLLGDQTGLVDDSMYGLFN